MTTLKRVTRFTTDEEKQLLLAALRAGSDREKALADLIEKIMPVIFDWLDTLPPGANPNDIITNAMNASVSMCSTVIQNIGLTPEQQAKAFSALIVHMPMALKGAKP